ncbi:MAG TPA: SprT family zinc-dependent metalloprotease [Verrucomicrobiae bacterium]|nr:SprT family zinc-dependent metalloprotease [Verrucomicrobiae bacterium]
MAVVRSRRARRYVLRLRADGLARLTIPRSGSEREAWEFALRQGAWLERQLQYLASRPVRPTKWQVGTEILFRGERIKIETSSHSNFAADQPSDLFDLPLINCGMRNAECGIFDSVRLGREIIPVADGAGDLRPAIEAHLRGLAAKELPSRTFEFAAIHRLSARRVMVRAQRSRWGSCSFKGLISLNWRLIQTPPFVRDYIILHELMHLRQMNHSAQFWREVEKVCPDYRTAKSWLKENPGLLDHL